MTDLSLFDRTDIPEIEIEIAADALQALWQSERNQRALRETGHGASFLYMAIVALEAAAKVRGRHAIQLEGDTLQ
jgi:hypothetical protein